MLLPPKTRHRCCGRLPLAEGGIFWGANAPPPRLSPPLPHMQQWPGVNLTGARRGATHTRA